MTRKQPTPVPAGAIKPAPPPAPPTTTVLQGANEPGGPWFDFCPQPRYTRKVHRPVVSDSSPVLNHEGVEIPRASQVTVGIDLATGPDYTVVMCGVCYLTSTSVKEIVDHDCPGPPLKPAEPEEDVCSECGRGRG